MSMDFPTAFSETLQPVHELRLDDRGQRALGQLVRKGFEVRYGVRRKDVPAITTIAHERPVREYCPKDVAERFTNEEAMAAWFQKDDGVGRAFFLLLPKRQGVLNRLLRRTVICGYGWTGPAKPSTFLPDCNTTFALRVSERAAGRGLGAPFTEVMVSATHGNFDGVEGVGLDTWETNAPAVITYRRAGAEAVSEEPSTRITLGTGTVETPQRIPATRVHMRFAQTLRPFVPAGA